jgi:peptidyl-prolyl cis-trans isomerase C
MHKKLAARATFLTMLGLSILPSLAQDSPVQNQPTVIARVGNVEISGVDIAIAAEQSIEQIMQLDEAQRSEFLLQSVIDMTLMAEAARKAGLDADPLLRQRIEFAEAQLLQRVYVDHVVKQATTDVALEAAYETYVAAFEPVEQRRFSHILAASEDSAGEALGRLAAGDTFADVAKALSVDPTAQNNVDLGFLSDGDMVGPLNEAGFALSQPGDVTAPIATQFGWHILRYEDSRMSEPDAFEDSRERLVGQLSETALRADLERLAAETPVEMQERPAAE